MSPFRIQPNNPIHFSKITLKKNTSSKNQGHDVLHKQLLKEWHERDDVKQMTDSLDIEVTTGEEPGVVETPDNGDATRESKARPKIVVEFYDKSGGNRVRLPQIEGNGAPLFNLARLERDWYYDILTTKSNVMDNLTKVFRAIIDEMS